MPLRRLIQPRQGEHACEGESRGRSKAGPGVVAGAAGQASSLRPRGEQGRVRFEVGGTQAELGEQLREECSS